MNNYINGFFCAANLNSAEVFVNFVQNFPNYAESDNSKLPIKSENVYGVVMTPDVARNLVDALQEVLNGDGTTPNPDGSEKNM